MISRSSEPESHPNGQVRGTAAPATPGPSTSPSTSLRTALRYFAGSRVVVSVVLLLFVLFSDLSEALESWHERQRFLWVSMAYVALALVYLLLGRRAGSRFHGHLIVQVMTDLVVLTLLVHLGGAMRGGIGVMLVVAVAGAAVLSPRRLAWGFAAAAALLLLAESGWRTVQLNDFDLTGVLGAGITGAACFVAALVVNWLAVRLDRQEELAQRRGEDLRNQLAITQLVVAELPQGVLVVSRDGTVRTFNRTGAALLGAPPSGGASLYSEGARGRWAVLGGALLQWRRSGDHAAMEPRRGRDTGDAGDRRGDTRELRLPPVDGDPVEMKVRVRFLEPTSAGGDTVLLIEDLRTLEERAQQLKLASMGRLSASIAHEVRNPLAAIRHANSLLAEQTSGVTESRLVRIVETNAVRIDRIVEDVLAMARREGPERESIDLAVFLPAFIAEYTSSGSIDPARIVLDIGATAPMRFDANHLRQVLVNLLGNALRHASAGRGAVRIEWRRTRDDRLELRITDDGSGVSPDALQHLFEPFFTTESRGTGLGLYLARELCHANAARIRYQPKGESPDARGAFVVEPESLDPPSQSDG